jgi:hypothetical protein
VLGFRGLRVVYIRADYMVWSFEVQAFQVFRVPVLRVCGSPVWKVDAIQGSKLIGFGFRVSDFGFRALGLSLGFRV